MNTTNESNDIPNEELTAFKYNGFWQCIDTKRDIDKINKILSAKKKIKF